MARWHQLLGDLDGRQGREVGVFEAEASSAQSLCAMPRVPGFPAASDYKRGGIDASRHRQDARRSERRNRSALLAREITDLVVKHAGTTEDQVDVIIEDYARENWAKGGVLFSDK